MAARSDAPAAPDPGWPRYGTHAFPPRRYVPGRGPHPRRDPARPRGPVPAAFRPERWAGSAAYRHGIDLYNHAYWWESHEVFEGLLHALGRGATPQVGVLRALIWLAAAELKRFVGLRRAADHFLERARAALDPTLGRFMGLDVPDLARRIEARRAGSGGPVLLRLEPAPGDETLSSPPA